MTETTETTELLKKYFPDIHVIINNIKYNKAQDITNYFGKEIQVIYAGHGGNGWNFRTLLGYFNEDKSYLKICGSDEKDFTLISITEWFSQVVLPESFDVMKNHFKQHSAPILPNDLM